MLKAKKEIEAWQRRYKKAEFLTRSREAKKKNDLLNNAKFSKHSKFRNTKVLWKWIEGGAINDRINNKLIELIKNFG